MWTNQSTKSITIPSGATTGARVVIDENGITEYNASNQIVAQLSSAGTASFSGAISGASISGSSISGSTISGGTIYTASNYLSNVINWYQPGATAINTTPTLVGVVSPNVPYTNSAFQLIGSWSGFSTLSTTPNRATIELRRGTSTIIARQFQQIDNANTQGGGTIFATDTPGVTGSIYYYLYAFLATGSGYIGGTGVGEGAWLTELPYLGG